MKMEYKFSMTITINIVSLKYEIYDGMPGSYLTPPMLS